METIEYSAIQKTLYKSTKKEPFFITVPKMNYITYTGSGHPNEQDFQDACHALFTLSYIIKFKIAHVQLQKDYKVNPLEVNWYLDKTHKKIAFTWLAMIMQPDCITEQHYKEAIQIAQKENKELNYDKVAYQTIDFDTSVQCFHKGDYNTMNDTMNKMFEFAESHDCTHDLYTHDIYLNDSRKTKVENLKSIMRICVQHK